MVSNVVKVIVGIIILLIGFYFYQYNFGSMYGGKKYQRKAKHAEAKVLLNKYYEQQKTEFEATGKYNPDFHKQEPFVSSRSFKLLFVEDGNLEFIKYCADCKFLDNSFKIGAFAIIDGNVTLFTINQSGNMVLENFE